jgi:hypothetical protein
VPRALLTFALLALAARVSADGCALAVSMNLEEMTARADRIFVGECVSAEARFAPIGGANLPVTLYTFAVDEMIRGEPSETVSFRQCGHPPIEGERGLEGLAQFVPGERYLLLLAPADSPKDLTTTIGLDQGAFRFMQDEQGRRVLLNGRANAGLLDRLSPQAQARVLPLSQTADPADAILATVRALAAETAP